MRFALDILLFGIALSKLQRNSDTDKIFEIAKSFNI